MGSGTGKFDLLDVLGISPVVQSLFSDIWQEEEWGMLKAIYRDIEGVPVDDELLGLSCFKKASEGVVWVAGCPREWVRSVYISDALSHILFFLKTQGIRLDLGHSAFVATGAKLDKELLKSVLDSFPGKAKYHTLFGHSVIGRIKDCKVQHWKQGRDCRFWIERDHVRQEYEGKQYSCPIPTFSLRQHMRQLGVRQSISTCKPKHKKIENFYSINYF